MKCRKVKTLLAAYLYGDLKTRRKAGVDKHLGSCGSCAAELQRLREVVDLMPDEFVDFPGGEEWERFEEKALARALAAERLLSIREIAAPSWSWKRALTPAFAAAIIALASLAVFRGLIISDRAVAPPSGYGDVLLAPDDEGSENGLLFLAAVEQDEQTVEAALREIDEIEREIDSIVGFDLIKGGVS